MKKIIMFCLLAVLGFGISNASAQKKNAASLKTTVFVIEKGVKEVKVDVPTKTVTVTYDAAKTSDATLLKAFKKIKVAAEVAPAKK